MLRYLENVVTLQLDSETCNGCGTCAVVCPRGVFEIKDRKANIVDQDACIECGACVINCPVNALQVRSGAGCASGILLSRLGFENECCTSDCGVSPTTTETTQSSCCAPPAQNPANTEKTQSSCCGSASKQTKTDNHSSSSRCSR